MVEMVAAVEVPQRREFQHDAEQQGRAERQQRAQHETAGPGDEGRGEIGAHHVERAVREIDEVHDAEHQRQPRRQQEQQQPELQAVQELFDDEEHRVFRRPLYSSVAPRCHFTLPWRISKKSGSALSAAALPSKIRAHFIGHLSWKRSWSSLTMVATVFSESWPSASLTTSCR